MADTRTLQILLTAKDNASKQLAGINGKLKTMQPAFKKMAVVGTAALAAIGAGAKKAINSASDLGESVNAVNVVFGEASEGILALGDAAAKAVGLSKKDFNSLAVQFSNFAQIVAGEGGDVVSTMDDLTGRAADFASVMNIDVANAATLFQSGLAGQTEPLRRYGIDLSAAAVKAHALAVGIGGATGELSEAEKVQARYSLLMESTLKTQDDFANTSDSMANAQRIMAAEMENLSAVIGDRLQPIIESLQKILAPVISKVSEWIQKNPELSKWIIIVAGGVAALAVAAGLLGMALTVLTGPIGLVLIAITAVIAIGVVLIKHWDTIKEKASSLTKAIGGFFAGMWDGIKEGMKSGINFFIDKINWVIRQYNRIRSTISKVPGVSLDAVGEIPALAKGGIVNKPTLAMIGEAGPEAIVPLGKSGGIGGVTINISGGNFVGGSAEELADMLGDKIMDSLRNNTKLNVAF